MGTVLYAICPSCRPTESVEAHLIKQDYTVNCDNNLQCAKNFMQFSFWTRINSTSSFVTDNHMQNWLLIG